MVPHVSPFLVIGEAGGEAEEGLGVPGGGEAEEGLGVPGGGKGSATVRGWRGQQKGRPGWGGLVVG